MNPTFYSENDFRLYHHGILGMSWGKRNGPPYPLHPSDHSAAERKAGWRQSLGGGALKKKKLKAKAIEKNSTKKTVDDRGEKRRGLSDKQKKVLKTTAIVAGTALAAYGGYKLHKAIKSVDADSISRAKKIIDDHMSNEIRRSANISSMTGRMAPRTDIGSFTRNTMNSEIKKGRNLKNIARVAGNDIRNDVSKVKNLAGKGASALRENGSKAASRASELAREGTRSLRENGSKAASRASELAREGTRSLRENGSKAASRAKDLVGNSSKAVRGSTAAATSRAKDLVGNGSKAVRGSTATAASKTKDAFSESVERARKTGVKESEILKDVKDVDDFFTGGSGKKAQETVKKVASAAQSPKVSNEAKGALGASVARARQAGVKDNDILKSLDDIDDFFGGGKSSGKSGEQAFRKAASEVDDLTEELLKRNRRG